MHKEYMNVLFDPEDQVCAGSFKETSVKQFRPLTPKEFISINPLTVSRADINVTKFRNFLFEIDCIDNIDNQRKLLDTLDVTFSAITYSGGKSLHAIISLETPLSLEPHSPESLLQYKVLWQRLSLYLTSSLYDSNCSELLPDSGLSLFDSACKNPSRFTRMPGYTAPGRKKQDLLELNGRMSDAEWANLHTKLPEISFNIKSNFDRPENEVKSSKLFWAICPKALGNKIQFVDWADSAGMHPIIVRLTCWAIDTTNINEDTWVEILEEYVEPSLVDVGYEEGKVERSARGAFEWYYQKGGLKHG